LTDSWKIGAVSGLIASLFTGTVLAPSFLKMAVSMELWDPWWSPIVSKSISITIPINIIFGIILGLIYSKIYPAIPGKGALKGLIWGLILYVIIAVRIDTFWLAYGWTAPELFTWLPIILLGLITGILYEFLCSRYCPIKEVKIKRYSIISGFHPGAIAGLCGGIAASIVAVSGPAMGLWEIAGGPAELSFDFWLGQAGTHIIINMFWGTIFGLMFTRVYDLVPGKGVTKGLVYGLTVYLITSGQLSIYPILMIVYANAWPAFLYMGNTVVGIPQAFVFALVLGLLYRKPAETPSMKKEDIQTVKMVKCIHCSASIPKDSKYCKECSKKQ